MGRDQFLRKILSKFI